MIYVNNMSYVNNVLIIRFTYLIKTTKNNLNYLKYNILIILCYLLIYKNEKRKL